MILGKVGRAHGLRGAFFVSGREAPIPPAYRDVRIGPTLATAQPAAIRASHLQAGRPLLACTLAADRTGAEALVGQWIYVERTKVSGVVRASGDVLWSDLVGKAVVDVAGTAIGRVHHVYNAGASDVVEVHDAQGRSVDLPLVANYVDLARPLTNGPDGAPRLQLLVGAAMFADVWDDSPSSPAPADAAGDDDA